MTITPEELNRIREEIRNPGLISAFSYNTVAALLAHIDAQAARIAELTNKNEHLRLLAEEQNNLAITANLNSTAIAVANEALEKELAALREQNPKLEYIRRLEKELSALRQSAAPVAVPGMIKDVTFNCSDPFGHGVQCGEVKGWNACIDEVLRLNSGSKPE